MLHKYSKDISNLIYYNLFFFNKQPRENKNSRVCINQLVFPSVTNVTINWILANDSAN